MNKLFKAAFLPHLLFLILSVFTLPIPLLAESIDNIQPIVLKKQPKHDKEHNQTLDRDGQRMPSRKITAYISINDGVYSPYFETDDIISYSIIGCDGNTIYNGSDVYGFINSLYEYNEMMIIVLEFDSYILSGYVHPYS